MHEVERWQRLRRNRELSELIVRRADFLAPSDRELIIDVFGRGRRTRDLAVLLRQPVSRVRRRVRALTQRLLSDRFLFVVRNHQRWPTLRRQIGTACILRGETTRDAAARAGASLHAARRELDAISALIDSFEGDRRD